MALNFGGILGAVTSLFGDDGIKAATPIQRISPSRLVTASGQGSIPPVTPGAPGLIALILSGAGDAAVRVAARTARVGKKQLLETLVAMTMLSDDRAFSTSDKMFISNEIEKIFKPRRRRTIPASLKRSVAQINWIKKNLRGLFK